MISDSRMQPVAVQYWRTERPVGTSLVDGGFLKSDIHL